MKIIGIHDGHNSSVCLLENGKIQYVIQEERITREKNYDGFPTLSLKLLLEKSKLKPSDIDIVALNGNHQPKSMTRLERLDAFKNLSSSGSFIKSKLKKIKVVNNLYKNLNNTIRIKKLLDAGFENSQIEYVEHHTAHAASTYYCNITNDEKVLVLTNDGAGDRLCATVSIGCEGKLERISEVKEKHSVGLLYAMFTFLTGMVPLEHEFKIMGMAPYADVKNSQLIADQFHQMFDVSDDGLTWRFIKGDSIYQSLQYFKDFMFLKRFDHLMAGLQLFIEQFLSRWVQACVNKTGISRVAVSGGTFMNVKANKSIMELEEVSSLFIFPSCGDESNAIGAAYHCLFEKNPQQIVENLSNIYFGIEFSDNDILTCYKNYTFKNKYNIHFSENIEKEIAECLSENNVIARFSGREEFGARSLGNRAILGNPSSPEVIKEINEMIKNRDFWMPFASSILDEDFDKYVQSDGKNMPYYMVMTYDTKLAANEIIAGIHPYDKTIRPQLVTQKQNSSYWKMLKEFKELTGLGGVLNTSLNLHGLPLVHKPEDAFEVLEKSELKYLAIGNYMISKAN